MGLNGKLKKPPIDFHLKRLLCPGFIILSIGLLFGCANSTKEKANNHTIELTNKKKKTKYIRNIRILSPTSKNTYPAQKRLNIEFTFKRHSDIIDSTQIFIDKKKVAVLNKATNKHVWVPSGNKMGVHQLKILSFQSDGKIGIASRNFVIVSDLKPEFLKFKIVSTYPHGKKSFTQGLVYDDGFLYESTGGFGTSQIKKIDIQTGKVLKKYSNSNKYFGEGITLLEDKIYQLTWHSGEGFIYDKNTLTKSDVFNISGFSSEGWGITNNSKELIISNGSHKLFFINRTNFKLTKVLEVCDNQKLIKNINELEYIEGKIFANIWLSDIIIIIDPLTGKVTGKIDCSNLLTENEKKKLDTSDDVLNGIAYNSQNQHIYLTGKQWPKIFEIVLEKPLRK